MKRRYSLLARDEQDVDRAPAHFSHVIRTKVSPEVAFEYVVDLEREAEWFPDYVGGGWTTPPPHGVGSERWYETDVVWLHERFVRWEAARRLTFVGTAINLPLVTQFAEDYRFVPTSEGTDIHWRVGYTPRPLFRPLHPVIRPYFAHTFTVAARQLASALGSSDRQS